MRILCTYLEIANNIKVILKWFFYNQKRSLSIPRISFKRSSERNCRRK
ncbi:hypothetical protein [Methanobrevibacter sp.]|nr:hypothetical protein [Methanobrevibacter sp.]MBQ2961542.1 hypothetical protein [Methanobrevibacter sp.]